MAIPAFSLANRLRAGETVFSGWCGLPYPLVAEMIGRDGFPAVTLDSQHGLWDLDAILTAIAAVRQGGAAPIVRVPVGDFATVSRALDFGAEGIIAPMINTPADARALAAAAKYPPVGERSWGPHRAMTLAGIADQSVYLREANDHVVTLAMIETRTALKNLDAIVERRASTASSSVPSDLSIALSDGKTLDPLSKEVDRELDRILAARATGEENPRRLLPFGRARRRTRQARGALPRRDERSRDAARRRGRGDESAQGLNDGAPALPGRGPRIARPAASAPRCGRAKYPMVYQRGGRVNARENQKRIRQIFVHLEDAPRQRAVGRPRRCEIPKPKIGNVIAALELDDDPDERHRHKQCIQRVMAQPCRQFQKPTEPRRLGRRRRIGEPPHQPRDQQRHHALAERHVREKAEWRGDCLSEYNRRTVRAANRRSRKSP